MSRVAQPREVAELKGLVQHNPQRYRKQPAKSEFALGQCPDYLDDGSKAVWFELETYAAKGVLTGGDRMVLELTCALMSEFRDEPRKFAAAKIGHLISCFARLGLTPADRQKIGFDKPKEENPFDAL